MVWSFEKDPKKPMSVLNPRNRLVNFRLSEAEFDELKCVCRDRGARSISEFARSSVLRSLDGQAAKQEASGEQVQDLERKVGSLEVRVEQLLHLVTMAGVSSPDRVLGAQPAPTNGDAQHY